MQAEPFQRQQWEEEPALACGEPLTESAALRDRIRREGDGLELDVGILVDLVRRVVVPGMLRPPPGHTHAGDRAREDACRPVVPGRGVEDLPMRAVVAEERDLHEDERERNGQHQLEPGVAEQDHADGDGQQRRQDHADPGVVVALAPPQQAELPHSLEEIRVQADVPLLGAHAVIIKNHRDARRAVRWTGEVGWAKCISSGSARRVGTGTGRAPAARRCSGSRRRSCTTRRSRPRCTSPHAGRSTRGRSAGPP